MNEPYDLFYGYYDNDARVDRARRLNWHQNRFETPDPLNYRLDATRFVSCDAYLRRARNVQDYFHFLQRCRR